ncbi:MAG: cytochrome c [Deltaproteobacteria bacterium]|nr:cytochrome c [Deltaproteobacteria bacterium]
MKTGFRSAKKTLAAFAVAFVTLAAMPAAAHAADNPLFAEMLFIDKAFRDIVSAVALGDTDTVVKAVESLHGAAEKTKAAIAEGGVKLRKNADRMKEFERLDKEFHKNLGILSEAASKKNRPKMLATAKRLLDGCIQCHQTFR